MVSENIWLVGETAYVMHNNKISKGVITDLDDDKKSYRMKFPGWITWVNKREMHKSIDELITYLKVQFANDLENQKDESH